MELRIERRHDIHAHPQPNREQYNLGVHIAGLFIILVISLLAAAFPVITNRLKWLKIHPGTYFFCKHFGTGVLFATAFAHLAPTAFLCFRDIKAVDERYAAAPGVIALAAILVIFALELWMHGKLQHGHDNVTASAAPEKLRRKQRVSHERQFGADINDEDDEDQRQHIRFGGSEGEDDNNEEEDKNNTLTPLELRKMSMDILLLEAGILFHSVFVGITLSIATRGFWMLLLAFSFHQLFEGLGLGARIAAVPFVKRSLRPWMLVLAFGLTAPGGQAIGLGLHDWYDPGSAVALVLNGVFNSMSFGLLVWSSIVDLIYNDFFSRQADKNLSARSRLAAFGLVGLGAGAMCVVAAWA